jgi:excisionase family DNA binding protein
MSLEPYVPIEELAKHLTLSVSTVRTWLRQNLIPRDTYIKVGNTYRFNVSKVVEALTRNDPDPMLPEAPIGEYDPVQLELDFASPDDDI